MVDVFGLGKLLEGERGGFFVDAKRRDSVPTKLYQYSVEGKEDPVVRMSHLTPSQGGECLTLSSSRGRLVSRGTSCKKQRKPLCHRPGPRFSVARMESTIACMEP